MNLVERDVRTLRHFRAYAEATDDLQRGIQTLRDRLWADNRAPKGALADVDHLADLLSSLAMLVGYLAWDLADHAGGATSGETSGDASGGGGVVSPVAASSAP